MKNKSVIQKEYEKIMKNSSCFFKNYECAYFPCHESETIDEFNCLFCYCPLYHSADCGGNYSFFENGLKDCSACLLPHRAENYQYIIDKLKDENNLKNETA